MYNLNLAFETMIESANGGTVGIPEILTQIDREIALLESARAFLSQEAVSPKATAGPRSGRRRKKRNLTPEGRKRIVEAVKRRWASQKATAKKKWSRESKFKPTPVQQDRSYLRTRRIGDR